jgi:DNA polymerase I-like protein with 3'-5' exonuclease and polymerase domains
MLVESIEHANFAIKHLLSRMTKGRRWVCGDTETEAKPGFDKDDAIIVGRAQIIFFSFCYCGESYSFPTSYYSTQYPTVYEYADLFRKLAEDKTLVKTFHNANYDVNVTKEIGLNWKPFWCTMIGAWKAEAERENGLKSRALLYGRVLSTTKSIDFTNLEQAAAYAEEDVVVGDEMYQMQRYGYILRPKYIEYVNAKGRIEEVKNFMPSGKIVIPDEDLDKMERAEVRMQELPYLKSTLRAERFGFPFDVKLLDDIRKEVNEAKDDLLKKIIKIAGSTINLGSSKQMIGLFNSLGIAITRKTKKGADSLDAKSLLSLKGKHKLVDLMIEYRKVETQQTNFVGNPNPSKKSKKKNNRGLGYFVTKGRIHASVKTIGAVTGRTTVSRPNLTQLPASKDQFGIRRCFLPPKGQLLLCIDYAQIELRVGALYHQDPVMVEVLRDPKGDLHQKTADEFGVVRDPVSKNINFLFQFGGGAYALAELMTANGVPTTPEKAQPLVLRYDEVYAKVSPFRKALLQEHSNNGFVRLLTGRKRHYLAGIDWENRSRLHKAETTLANNVIQGAAQDFLKATIIRLDHYSFNPDKAILQKWSLPRQHAAIVKDYSRKLEKYRRTLKLAHTRWLLQVHDESLWVCDKEAAEEILHICAEVMCWRHYIPSIRPYCVPLVAEGGVGETWKEAKGKSSQFHLKYGFEEPVDDI